MYLQNIANKKLSVSRSLSPENPNGSKGGGAKAKPLPDSPARDLGVGWKARPYIEIESGETAVIADVEGPGVIQQIWMTIYKPWRSAILRMYWDDNPDPSVECPLGDFFCCGWERFCQISSLPVCVNPGSAFNAHWPMPFRKRCRITLENRAPFTTRLYYQINYALEEVGKDALYFHAFFNRSNPLPYLTEHTILEKVKSLGHYVGTYIAWGVNSNGWWGEGEVKFFLDGDKRHPTICGTGTEDYFLGSYNFENQAIHQYQEYTTPHSGLPQVLRPDGLYLSQQRFGMYRWHLSDPIRFKKDIKVTVQALGWRADKRFLPLQDDISSTAFWYQELPYKSIRKLQDRDTLEVV